MTIANVAPAAPAASPAAIRDRGLVGPREQPAPAARAQATAPAARPTEAEVHGLVRRAASTTGAFVGGVAGLMGMDLVLNLVAFSWTPPIAVVVGMVVACVGAGIAAGWTGAGALADRLAPHAPAAAPAAKPALPVQVAQGAYDAAVVIGRHPRPAMMGTLMGGGALAIAALTVGIASGPVVAAAGFVGAAAGAWALAKGASLITGR